MDLGACEYMVTCPTDHLLLDAINSLDMPHTLELDIDHLTLIKWCKFTHHVLSVSLFINILLMLITFIPCLLPHVAFCSFFGPFFVSLLFYLFFPVFLVFYLAL